MRIWHRFYFRVDLENADLGAKNAELFCGFVADLNADLFMRIRPNVADLPCGSGCGSRTGSDAVLAPHIRNAVLFLGQIRCFFRPEPVLVCGSEVFLRILCGFICGSHFGLIF